jgi:hypothetical protein
VSLEQQKLASGVSGVCFRLSIPGLAVALKITAPIHSLNSQCLFYLFTYLFQGYVFQHG